MIISRHSLRGAKPFEQVRLDGCGLDESILLGYEEVKRCIATGLSLEIGKLESQRVNASLCKPTMSFDGLAYRVIDSWDRVASSNPIAATERIACASPIEDLLNFANTGWDHPCTRRLDVVAIPKEQMRGCRSHSQIAVVSCC
ncbi:hypothetical protein BD410DRAFT_131310 [Rickenella mellea]|uniref:Uncharacterized protein n=1 Tax=Rickenella mellea TaxID=50990 RepID=A0A4Y7Q9U2_9AGAM|nr:hypothetical protein BD410DRAFT_131310 [Rickenella mellea]